MSDPKDSRSKSATAADGIRKGRFESGMDPLFAAFNASIGFDRRLAEYDITGSLAHVRMLGKTGIIPQSDADRIEQGLLAVLEDIRSGRFRFRDDLEDVHINVETALRDKIGEVAGKLHTARSRNDQVALDLRLYLKEQVESIADSVLRLIESLVGRAEETVDIILPGYTHLQRAQPVRLAHHLAAYCEMFRRDWERFTESMQRIDVMPLGSAALAGTTFPVDRAMVAADLGFSEISRNSMDAVSDRDIVAEFLFKASMVMTHLSRLAEELILWSSQEFRFCVLPDAYCSGSSIMPQKKNPDACELIRGKTGRVVGHLVGLFMMLKAMPLTYNKDLQEDKEPLFDTVDTVRTSLDIMSSVIAGTEFNGETMGAAAADPALAATDLADRLAREGVPFREAHERIGQAVRAGLEGDAASGSAMELPSPEEMVEARNQFGGTSRDRVMEQIQACTRFLETARDRRRR